MESSEKKLQVRNLKRIAKQTFEFYEAAEQARKNTTVVRMGERFIDVRSPPVVKRKVIRRSDGTFDLVWFVPVEVTTPAAPSPVVDKSAPKKPRRHGLRAKDRRAQERKKHHHDKR
jgi:hypothetical protein